MKKIPISEPAFAAADVLVRYYTDPAMVQAAVLSLMTPEQTAETMVALATRVLERQDLKPGTAVVGAAWESVTDVDVMAMADLAISYTWWDDLEPLVTAVRQLQTQGHQTRLVSTLLALAAAVRNERES